MQNKEMWKKHENRQISTCMSHLLQDFSEIKKCGRRNTDMIAPFILHRSSHQRCSLNKGVLRRPPGLLRIRLRLIFANVICCSRLRFEWAISCLKFARVFFYLMSLVELKK